MSFPPPKMPYNLSKVPTSMPSVLSFKEFFGGGVVHRDFHGNSSSHNFVHPYLQMNPPIEKPSYLVRWTDFEKVLSQKFADMYGSTDSTDVSIVCGMNRDILKAHQLVLSMGSLYFRDALQMAPTEHPVILVRNSSGNSMRKILDYIYLGQAAFMTEIELNTFIDEAKYLQIIGIQEGKYSLSV